jgi:dipeptidyl aminopeptidase/acylaminoacyl peptidase
MLMGGSPDRLPERYEVADPLRRVPLSTPVLLVHGVLDETVSIELSRSYAHAAREAGGAVELIEIEGEPGRHRAFIDPRGAAWKPVAARLEMQMADAKGRSAALGS